MKLIRSYQELVAWIREHTDQQNPEQAALWFVSYQEAQLAFDSMDTKDLASAIQDGFGPVTPGYVNSFIRTLYEELLDGAELDNPTDLKDEIDDNVAEEFDIYDLEAELKLFYNVG